MARPLEDVPLNSICHCHTEYRRKRLVSTYRLRKGRQEVDVTVKPEACGFRLVTNCYSERTLDNPLLWNLNDQTHAKWTFERLSTEIDQESLYWGHVQGLFSQTCTGLDISFQLQLLLRWWTLKKNTGLRKLCICFTFQTQKRHPSFILSACKQS